MLEARVGWRGAFFAAGAPGLVLAILCLLVREPTRKLSDAPLGLFAAAQSVLRGADYRRAVLGYCFLTFAIGAFAYWAPTFLHDVHKVPLARGNFLFGLTTVVAGAVGTAVGGSWADRKAARDRTDGETRDATLVRSSQRVCFYGAALGTPLAAAAFLAPNATLFFVAVFACELALFMTQSPINAVLLRTVPNELRGSAIAVAVFMIHMFGDLWSNPLVGKVTDATGDMRPAMMVLPVALVFAAVAWWRPKHPHKLDESRAWSRR
jgi:hypothetical protein